MLTKQINTFSVVTMDSRDLLSIINKVRQEVGEPTLRLNKFNEKIKDELEGENYTKSVVQNPNNTESEVYELTFDQCTLIGMRESKIVRKNVLEQLKLRRSTLDLNNPVQLRTLLLNYTEQNILLVQENNSLVKTIDTITNTESSVKFQQACKILNVKQQTLANWLRANGWDRYINSSRASTHYSQERGYCETKYEEVDGVKSCGQPYNYTKIEFFIKPKGMAVLSKQFGGEV